MMYVRYPLSLRQVEDILSERGIEICHETIRFWWNHFGPMFAAEIRQRRIQARSYSQWRWHLDEVFVRINGETHYLWRAVDHESEVLESFVSKRRDHKAALKFFRKLTKRYGQPAKNSTPLKRGQPSDLAHMPALNMQKCWNACGERCYTEPMVTDDSKTFWTSLFNHGQ